MRPHGVILLSYCVPWLERWAQHNHDEGHLDHSQWRSGRTINCCNSEDCGFLRDDEWRHGKEGDEIKIQGKWCPVKPTHYITEGKSPDWSHAHAWR
jgi:hypothetical protein